MRKFTLFTLIISMILCLCSCTQQDITKQDITKDRDFDKTTPVLKNDMAEKDSPDQIKKQSAFQTIAEKEGDTYIYFPDQEYTNWSYIEDVTAEGDTVPDSYSKLLKSIGSNGLIVAGRAEGLRKGNKNTLNTVTTFRVEKVLWGQFSGETIEIIERYYPINEKDNHHIFYYGDWYTLLKDGDLVLLFLSYNAKTDQYSTRYYQLPLPEDYLNFSENSLTELLNYYRNHKDSMKTVPPESSSSSVIKNDDGTETVEIHYGKPLVELKKTNKEMLKLMDDHILVQVAAQLKIKIWPQNHIQYTGRETFLGDVGIKAEWNGTL